MKTFAVFDVSTNVIHVEALIEYVAEWHMNSGRLVSLLTGPDRSAVALMQGVIEYGRHKTMLNNLVEHAATLGIVIEEDYIYGADGRKQWFHNGALIDSIDPLEGWELIGKVNPPMTSTFCICNLVTGECTTTAPTPELIERAYHAAWAPKRGPEQVIAEFPAAFGVTIHNFNTFPSTMVYDGIALYARRKAQP